MIDNTLDGSCMHLFLLYTREEDSLLLWCELSASGELLLSAGGYVTCGSAVTTATGGYVVTAGVIQVGRVTSAITG